MISHQKKNIIIIIIINLKGYKYSKQEISTGYSGNKKL